MILNVNNVSFNYSDSRVLNGITFGIEKGDFLGIIGSNGTGKSTLIKLILGLLTPSSGKIEINSGSAIGYVSQKAAAFNQSFPATVKEVVSAACVRRGLGRLTAEDKENTEKCLMAVGMEEYGNRLIGKLSGGQQQRVFIARALVCNPDILILDEPTVGVDARSVAQITKLISGLNKSGITIIMTNHDTHSLVALADKLLVLDEDGTGTLMNRNEFLNI